MHVIARVRTGPVRRSFFFLIYLKWLITVMGPNKTKPLISVQGLSGNYPSFFIFSPVIVSACSTRAYRFHAPRPV